MSLTEELDQIIANYNLAQQAVPERIRQENPKLSEELIEMLINLSINKNIIWFAAEILSFNLVVKDITPKTEDELHDIRIATEKTKLYMSMILLSREPCVHLPDFNSNDPRDTLKLVTLMKQYPEVCWLKLILQ